MVVVTVLLAFFLSVWAFLWERQRHRTTTRACEEQQRRLNEVELLLRRRAVLAQEVAHEIKNPITAILCSAETLDLLLGKSLDGLHRESLHYIRDYGDQLLRLVSDFLDVSCLEMHRMQPRLEAVPLLPTVQSVVGLLQSNAQRKAIDLTIEEGSEGLLVQADPKHLKQILFNLLHNALKFTPEGGQVRVQFRGIDAGRSVEVIVSDTGPGVPTEMQPYLFDPYVRGSHAGSTVNVGVGLGLGLARSLCEMGGGSLVYESVYESLPASGATFKVTLPRAVVDADMQRWLASLTKETRDGEPLKGRRLLLVEPDPGSGTAIKRLLEAWGGMVDLVHESTEALNALQRATYDTVMLDDDHNAAEQGRLFEEMASRTDHDIKTVVLSSENEEPSEPNCTLLKKPVNGAGLLSTLLRE